ncbi:hypothetical protein ANCDUO_02257 [Ancylostoma duodenale]|uniref:Ion transport domain-containing protein n=1 Tax=Ancylostoma duodenale TaxID=51022 RepID=A0A0C2H0Z5_9BILA|nr:hypothetical protein ANCDUO_02257 [Ancylostoma duodenale]
MMIGEFEFTAIFHGNEDSHLERLFGPTIAYPLFLFFCVIMTILLMNLLVGLAVDDIKSVQEKAELKRLSMQARKIRYDVGLTEMRRHRTLNATLDTGDEHMA